MTTELNPIQSVNKRLDSIRKGVETLRTELGKPYDDANVQQRINCIVERLQSNITSAQRVLSDSPIDPNIQNAQTAQITHIAQEIRGIGNRACRWVPAAAKQGPLSLEKQIYELNGEIDNLSTALRDIENSPVRDIPANVQMKISLKQKIAAFLHLLGTWIQNIIAKMKSKPADAATETATVTNQAAAVEEPLAAPDTRSVLRSEILELIKPKYSLPDDERSIARVLCTLENTLSENKASNSFDEAELQAALTRLLHTSTDAELNAQKDLLQEASKFKNFSNDEFKAKQTELRKNVADARVNEADAWENETDRETFQQRRKEISQEQQAINIARTCRQQNTWPQPMIRSSSPASTNSEGATPSLPSSQPASNSSITSQTHPFLRAHGSEEQWRANILGDIITMLGGQKTENLESFHRTTNKLMDIAEDTQVELDDQDRLVLNILYVLRHGKPARNDFSLCKNFAAFWKSTAVGQYERYQTDLEALATLRSNLEDEGLKDASLAYAKTTLEEKLNKREEQVLDRVPGELLATSLRNALNGQSIGLRDRQKTIEAISEFQKSKIGVIYELIRDKSDRTKIYNHA